MKLVDLAGNTIKFQYRLAMTHKIIALLLLLETILVLAISVRNESFTQAIGYVLAIGLSAFIIDTYSLRETAPIDNFPIKNVKKEIGLILGSVLVSAALSIVRFVVFPEWGQAPLVLRLALFPLVFLFIYPIFLLFSFLIMKYRPKTLGLRWNKVELAIPIVIIIAVTTLIVAPEKLQWSQMYNEVGLLGVLGLGFLSAAIPEEFVRFLMQTRLATVLNSQATGWFIAGLIWTILHIPKFYSQQTDLESATLSAVGILPIGLLWGYMTHRTRNIVPAILVHGTNLWGLHNL